MNILDDSITLLDVLSGWGLRECKKYPEIQVPSGQPTILGTEVVLRHVPKLIARILLAEPLDPAKLRGTFRADFGLEDIDKLILHCGVALTAAPPIASTTKRCGGSWRLRTLHQSSVRCRSPMMTRTT